MEILVINVCLRPHSPARYFPIGLAYIATAMKNAGWRFDLLDIEALRYSDDEITAFIAQKEYAVVCIGTLVTGYAAVKSLAAIVRRIHPHAKIIAGNTVATPIADTLLMKTDVDVAVMGEGDVTIVELLSALNHAQSLDDVKGIAFKQGGRVVRTGRRSYIRDISHIPMIDYSLFDVERYAGFSQHTVSDPLPLARDHIRAFPVNTARGCIERCTFCYHNFDGVPYRYRRADSLIREIEFLVSRYGINYIQFADELSFFSKEQIGDLLGKIMESGLRFYWIATCRAGLFADDRDLELLHKMKEAGCAGIGYSLESAEPRILEAMKKHIVPDLFSRQTSLLHKARIPVWTSIVLGYPQETHETINKTFDCCIANGIYPSTGYLLPLPGSSMYRYAREHKFIKDEEEYLLTMGERQDLRINMTAMPDEEFRETVMKELKRCNDALNIGLESENLIKTKYYRVPK